MTKPLTRQAGTPSPNRGAPTPGILRAQQVAAATRRAEIRKQQDRDILRQIQR
jgi:hypothetical protein